MIRIKNNWTVELGDNGQDLVGKDVLVSFAPNSPWTIIDLIVMELELAALVNRDVDLIEKRAIQNSSNPIRKAEILNSATVIYSQTTTDENRADFSQINPRANE